MAKAVKCPRCAKENDPSFAFCLDCGQNLKPAPPAATEGVCPGCGAKLGEGFRFCGHCGRPIEAAPTAPPLPAPPPAPAAAATTAPASVAVGAPALRLTAMRPDGLPGAVHALDREESVCGRTTGDLLLPEDPTVSPRHARFTLQGNLVRVEDLGSVNGTYLRLRAPRPLSVGDELRIGRQLLRLEPLPHPLPASEDAPRTWGSKDPGNRLRLAQLLDGGGLGEIFPLRSGENSVGREAGDITFPSDRYVSSRHARIDVGESVTVADLDSSNGTFVKLVGPADLEPGDQVLVGMQLLRIDA